MLKLVQLGMITPDVGLTLMLFDGKQEAQALMRERAQAAATGQGSVRTGSVNMGQAGLLEGTMAYEKA